MPGISTESCLANSQFNYPRPQIGSSRGGSELELGCYCSVWMLVEDRKSGVAGRLFQEAILDRSRFLDEFDHNSAQPSPMNYT